MWYLGFAIVAVVILIAAFFAYCRAFLSYKKVKKFFKKNGKTV